MKTFGQLVENILAEGDNQTAALKHKGFQEIGINKFLDGHDPKKIHTLTKPMKLDDAKVSKLSFGFSNRNGLNHDKIPDLAALHRGKWAKKEITLEPGTKVYTDHKYGHLYSSHPDYGFVRADYDDVDDHHRDKLKIGS